MKQWAAVGIALAVVLGSVWSLLQVVGQPYRPEMRMSFLRACQPNEIRVLWPPSPGWVAKVVINLDKKSMMGGQGNGISNSAPYLEAKAEGNPLTDEQISRTQALIDQLPAGEANTWSRDEFTSQLHIAYFRNGALQIRNFPEASLPAGIREMEQVLGVWFIRWGDPGDPPHMQITK